MRIDRGIILVLRENTGISGQRKRARQEYLTQQGDARIWKQIVEEVKLERAEQEKFEKEKAAREKARLQALQEEDKKREIRPTVPSPALKKASSSESAAESPPESTKKSADVSVDSPVKKDPPSDP